MAGKASKLAATSLILGIIGCCVLPGAILIVYLVRGTWLERFPLPMAIQISIFCAVFIVAPLAGIAALALGWKMLAKGATGRNKSISIAGASAGFVSIVIYVVFLFMLMNAREKARRSNCCSNLKMIGLAIRMYAENNKDEFPDKDNAAGFEMLRAGGYLEAPKMYTCPSTNTKPAPDGFSLSDDTVSYLYSGGLNESSDYEIGILCDKPGNHREYGVILFIDGHVQGFYGKDWINNCINPRLIKLYREEELKK